MVFLDYRMPCMDGIETLHRLKERYPDKAERTPVICLTASAVSGDREKMLAAGFTDYLSKPVNVGEMEQTLLRYLPAAKVTLTDAEEGGDDLSLLPKGLRDIPLIDVAAGVSFCGDAQDYLKALQTYAGSIESKAAELEKCLNEMDLTGFTLKVHALKSTSRSIGALDLSEHAKALEQAGDAGDAETIRADAPALLAEYRSLAEPLESLFAAERDAAEANRDYWAAEVSNLRTLFEAGAEAEHSVMEAENHLAEAEGACEELRKKFDDALTRYEALGEDVNAEYYAANERSFEAEIAALERELADYRALAAGSGGEKLSVGKLIAEEESQLQRLEDKLTRCTVRAERDGLVIDLPAESQSRVSPGDALVTVREDAACVLEVRVLTNEEPYLKTGDPVTLTQKLKSDRLTYQGRISQIDDYAEKTVSALGADEFRVRICVEIADGAALKDGYELEAMFTIYENDAALTVPNSALFREDGADCLFCSRRTVRRSCAK